MEKIYGKLAPKGLFRKQRWVMLDIDENGITYNSEPGHVFFNVSCYRGNYHR